MDKAIPMRTALLQSDSTETDLTGLGSKKLDKSPRFNFIKVFFLHKKEMQ